MDTQDIEVAKEELAKLVAAQQAADVWTQAATDEKVKLVRLALGLVGSGDREAQRFVVAQVRRCQHAHTAGLMALALFGLTVGPGGLYGVPPPPAPSDVLRELELLLSTASGMVFRAAVLAVLQTDREHALEKLAPFVDVEAASDEAGLQRFLEVATQSFAFEPVRPLVQRVVRTGVRLQDTRVAAALHGMVNYRPEWDDEIAHLIELDGVPPDLIFALVYNALRPRGGKKVDAKRRKLLVPLLEAVAAPLRDDLSARARLEAAEKALELPGALLSAKPVKLPKLAKALARIALKHGVGTEGGPVLALPKEGVASWRGTLLSDGKPAESDFSNTDYGRACNVLAGKSPWGPYGFVDVGSYRGLVLGSSCEVAKLADGTCLLVMQGDEESVGALMKEQKPWKKLDGELNLPSGQLVLFDSAMEQAKTNNKSTVKLAPGKFAVDEYDEDGRERELWIVRLTPLAAE